MVGNIAEALTQGPHFQVRTLSTGYILYVERVANILELCPHVTCGNKEKNINNITLGMTHLWNYIQTNGLYFR
jgi:hypothetical protein